MLETVTACGFKFCNANVQLAELFTVTLPQLKGRLLEHPDALVNVGAVTPEPYRIVEIPPAVALTDRLALKLAVDVGVMDTQKLSV
jgi:hypothetical protein